MARFSGKVAIITGGGSGIGLAVAKGLLAEGAKVFATGRRPGPLEDLAAQYPNDVAYLSADIGESGTAKRVVDAAVEQFGGVDFVVNNAGIGEVTPLSQSSDALIDSLLAVNLKGPLALCRDAQPELEKTRGAIVNISSVAGQAAVPGFAVYAATKSAGDRLTKVLANELGPLGIRVNTVAPGLTRTPMFERTMGPMPEAVEMMVAQTALRRVAEPEDVAKSVLWLLSEDSAWVTGQVIQASGGMMLS